MRFLVSRLSSLGDVVCSLPAAAALKAAYPDSRITWMVGKRFADAVRMCAAVDEVVVTNVGFTPKSWPRYDREFETAFDLQGLLKSAACIAFAKAKRKFGYHWQREGAWLFSQRVFPDPTSVHVVDQYVDVARAAGGIGDRADFAVYAKPQDEETIRRRLADEQISKPFVVLNAGAGWESKRWPSASFVQLVHMLDEAGIAPILVGGRTDEDWEVGEEIVLKSEKRAISWVGQTTIAELFALIGLSRAHVGGDTGSTHIAAALGKPAIGLYSITRPERSCPYGQIDNCLYDPKSLRNISPKQVMDKLMAVAKC